MERETVSYEYIKSKIVQEIIYRAVNGNYILFTCKVGKHPYYSVVTQAGEVFKSKSIEEAREHFNNL